MLIAAPQSCYVCCKKGEICLYTESISSLFKEKIPSQLFVFKMWDLCSFINPVSCSGSQEQESTFPLSL